MGLEGEALADREDTATPRQGPAVAIKAAGSTGQGNVGSHHRPALHQGFCQLGIAHGGVHILTGCRQQAHPLHLAEQSPETAPFIPIRHHLHRQADG